MIGIFKHSGDWRAELQSLFTRYQGRRAEGSPGIRKYRAKRKILNNIAKVSRRANRR